MADLMGERAKAIVDAAESLRANIDLQNSANAKIVAANEKARLEKRFKAIEDRLDALEDKPQTTPKGKK